MIQSVVQCTHTQAGTGFNPLKKFSTSICHCSRSIATQSHTFPPFNAILIDDIINQMKNVFSCSCFQMFTKEKFFVSCYAKLVSHKTHQIGIVQYGCTFIDLQGEKKKSTLLSGLLTVSSILSAISTILRFTVLFDGATIFNWFSCFFFKSHTRDANMFCSILLHINFSPTV